MRLLASASSIEHRFGRQRPAGQLTVYILYLEVPRHKLLANMCTT